MNFSKFVPAYHNYFGKQCRVADYGYTKLIELFEGMSSIIQVRTENDKIELEKEKRKWSFYRVVHN